jgi:two-component system response regulator WspF
MRIGIANDSRSAAEALRRVIANGSGHEVAWIARDGAEAVRLAVEDPADLVLMDLNMPGLDGVQATRAIMQRAPCAILVVTAQPQDSVGQVFRALGAGALDVIASPVLPGREGGAALLEKIRMVGALTAACQRQGAAHPGAAGVRRLVAIGASTGGPLALAAVLANLKAPPDVAIVVVQHIDAAFSNQFAEWLAGQLAMPVRTIADGDALAGGVVQVARTNDHLRLSPELHLRYTAEPRELVYRPSIDVFFHSLSLNWPFDATGILLTGMGRDGATGLLAMRQAGKTTIAQDEASCAVYGMPRAAAEMGAAGQILPLSNINTVLRATISAS